MNPRKVSPASPAVRSAPAVTPTDDDTRVGPVYSLQPAPSTRSPCRVYSASTS